MLLVYMTLTGNVDTFVGKTGMDSIELNPTNPLIEVDEDFIIVIPSYVGMITDEVSDFIEYKDNFKHLIGFASSGNLNFGDDLFCVNAKELSAIYEKPIVFMFEYEGTNKDVEDFKKEVEKIEVARTQQEG
jgi:protein involved in ribonucleotide reduction